MYTNATHKVLAEAASEGRVIRLSSILKERKCGIHVGVCLQSEWFILGLPSPPGATPGIVHTIISVHSHPMIVHTIISVH